MVRLAEVYGCLKGIVGKNADAVEVIEAVGSVKPSSDITSVRCRVGHYRFQVGTAVTALGELVCCADPFRRLGHRFDIERKTVGMRFAVCPDPVCNAFGRVRTG